MATAAKKLSKNDAADQLQQLLSTPFAVPTPQQGTTKTATFTGMLTTFNGLVTIPVKTYVAADEDKIAFRQVHTCNAKDIEKDSKTAPVFTPLKQGKMLCTTCNVDVERENITKAYEYEKDKFIAVAPSDIDAQKPASDKTMSITEYVEAGDIDPTFYESSEFVAPDKGGEQAFALIVESMRVSGLVGRGTRVKGGREQTFVIRPYGMHGMVMSYLYTAQEVRHCDKWADTVVPAEATELGVSLMEKFKADKFVPAAQDAYLANVRTMLAARVNGAPVTTPTVADAAKPTQDLMASLKLALESTKRKGAASGKK